MDAQIESQYQRKTKLSLERRREEEDNVSAGPPSPRSVRTLDEDEAAHEANRNVDLERGPPPAYSPRDAQGDSKPPTPAPAPENMQDIEIDDQDVQRPVSPNRRSPASDICCGGCCGMLVWVVAIQVMVFAVVISRADLQI